MDRNSIIGFVLIALLLFAYFTWFAPSPEVVKQPLAGDSLVVKPTDKTPTILSEAKGDTLFTQTADIKEESITLENDDLRIVFSNKGAVIREAELKKYKTYSQQPLVLVAPSRSRFSLTGSVNGKPLDLYQPMYSFKQNTFGDSTSIQFSTSSELTGEVKHIYTLPKNGYQLQYRIVAPGVNSETLTFNWFNRVPLVEKDINDSRSKTNINYYSTAGDFDGVSETSLDEETLDIPTSKWVSVKQKFFVTAFLTKKSFSGGKMITTVDAADSSTVKTANFSVSIPTTDVKSGGSNFTFYIGPNDYKTLETVSTGFRKNVDLGWPPVKWVNQFLIVPVFQLLTQYLTSYWLIITLMVMLIRLILLPLSYKSYLGMAKMRLLKPEIDVIKKQYEGDQVKFSQEQMKLFNEAGASPFSGCIPLLLQMPFLFAMFFLFPACIEFRQQTLWLADDISTYDSVLSFAFTIPFLGNHLSVYTLLMTLSTLVITWQNNQISTVEGPMKSMGYIMPVVFLFILNSFPASLSFYYLVSNVVSFAQQLLIKRFVDEDKILKVMEEHRKKQASTGSTKSSFMNKLQDAMKASEEARKKNKRN
jgi:YidC/Oxa1 family membrane protein insertase